MAADVIVVGLGSMGAAVARELARRGLSVIGLDRFHPPHERGAHAGGSRIIRTAYMEGAEYVPLVRRAFQMWRELETETGEALLTVTGGLMLGRPESVIVDGARQTARAHGLEHEMLDAAGVRRKFPQFTPGNDDVALFEADAGVLRPEAAITAMLRYARGAGADLRPGIAVHDWASTGGEVVVHTDQGVIVGGQLVLAPGAWAPDLVRLTVPMRVRRRIQHYWRGGPEFEPGRFPIWIWEDGPGRAPYGLPSVDGHIKAAQHYGEEPADPHVGAEPARPEEIAAMQEWLAGHIPGLTAWLGGKPCLYTLTADEHFVLGHHPEHPNVVVACGFSGHGFKFTPVVGEILADLLQHGRTRHPLGLFDPSRFAAGSRDDAGDRAEVG